MRQHVLAQSIVLTISLISSALFATSPVHHSQIEQSRSQLRSAFLGPDRWGNESLSPDQIDSQLKLHFESVLNILTTQTESSLAQAVARLEKHYGLELSQDDLEWVRNYLATKRAWQMRTLTSYADRGRFPQNEGQADKAVPIFVDNQGTHCAVGYLMHCSGHDDKVAGIVEQNNLVYVSDVEQGPLIDWVLVSGLTQAEAALIQPGYEPPEFQALLSDFQNPDFSLSMLGLTVTDLTVLEYSYDGGDDIDQAFDTGFNQIFGLGSSYDRPDEFGIAIGEGVYVPPSKYTVYEPQLSNWIFLGGESGPLGAPDPGDNSIMHWINYRVQADSEFIEQFGLTSTPFFNFNFIDPGGTLRVTTQILTPDLLLKSQGTLQSDPNDPFPFLNGSAFMNASGNDFWVSTYAVGYSEPGSFNAAQFTSLWHEIQVVPEPGSFALTSVLVGLTMLVRRRRN